MSDAEPEAEPEGSRAENVSALGRAENVLANQYIGIAAVAHSTRDLRQTAV